jgi:hypothetical protein
VAASPKRRQQLYPRKYHEELSSVQEMNTKQPAAPVSFQKIDTRVFSLLNDWKMIKEEKLQNPDRRDLT